MRRPGTQAGLAIITMVLGAALAGPAGAATSGAHPEAADFLYQIAKEYRQTGRWADAEHELRKALILDPTHAGARRELAQVEELMRTRRDAIEGALRRLAPGEEATDSMEPVLDAALAHDRAAGLASPRGLPPVAPAPVQGATRRAPDPATNRFEWFYVFGPSGEPEYGAMPEARWFVVQVPAGATVPVTIRVLDADTRDRHDEMDGGWNTTTTFRVYGRQLLDSRAVGPEARDGTTLTFGPYTADQAESADGLLVFRVEAEGLSGDDNNLFALEVSPATAEVAALNPAIRLAETPGTRMELFPEVPAGAQQVLVEQNFDLDPEGGRLRLVPVHRDGRHARAIPLRASASGSWAFTRVPVPPGTDGTRWVYRITKATQRKGNMAFQLSDPDGGQLPVYTSRGPATGVQPPVFSARQPVATRSASCRAFEFDGSGSHDPDRGQLSYLWDFGDGTTAEGVRVQHTYEQAGTYRVRLKVQDDSTTECCVAQAEETVVVNLPPTAVIDAEATACANGSVHFSGAQSADTPGETLRYVWDFGDGTTAEGAEVDHAFTKGGAYQVRLTVDDGRNTRCSVAQAVAPVRVNTPPSVKVGGTIRQCAAAATGPVGVALSAAGTRDADQDSLTYAWDFGDGATGTGEQVNHAYTQGGHFTAVVTVDDGTGTSCASATGVVPVFVNHPPVAVLAPSSPGCPGESVTVNAGSSTDADGDVLTYAWDFGDGTTERGSLVQHTYERSGTYPVRVTVNDGSGMACNAASAATEIAINAPPVAKMVVRPLEEPAATR